MADPAGWILFEMAALIIQNTASTLVSLLVLFGQFMASLGIVMGSGFGGFVLGLMILGIVCFLLAKFVFSSGRTILVMLVAGIVLLFLIYLGASM
jgi:hypothetical protein